MRGPISWMPRSAFPCLRLHPAAPRSRPPGPLRSWGRRAPAGPRHRNQEVTPREEPRKEVCIASRGRYSAAPRMSIYWRYVYYTRRVHDAHALRPARRGRGAAFEGTCALSNWRPNTETECRPPKSEVGGPNPSPEVGVGSAQRVSRRPVQSRGGGKKFGEVERKS
jgi:hypothetical protein